MDNKNILMKYDTINEYDLKLSEEKVVKREKKNSIFNEETEALSNFFYLLFPEFEENYSNEHSKKNNNNLLEDTWLIVN